ncbi:MAG: DNA replication complex subunit Gins51, partial [Candidatus Hodarchaeales archaeon]
TDGFQYGPLAIGDIVCLPYQNEKALVSRGVAVEIEIGWN